VKRLLMRETDTVKTIEPNPPLLTPVGFAVAAAAATAVAIIAFVLPQASAPSTWQSAPVVAQSRDAIPFRNVNGAMYVYASLGGVPHNMLLDTGANISTVTVPIANVLIARKQAYVLPASCGLIWPMDPQCQTNQSSFTK
jgi:hypothetical protein